MISTTSGTLKAELAELVAWNRQLPDYVFTRQGYPFAYFFESSVTGRRALLAELLEVLSKSYISTPCISIAHDARDGRYDADEISSTMLIHSWSNDLSGTFHAEFFEYIATHPYTGITCGANKAVDWMLYDDPANMVGVFVTKTSIDSYVADSDLIFDCTRFLELAVSPGMDLANDFVRSIERNYCKAP